MDKLIRSCLACGLEKPLAAFLQINGTQGTVYGNICSSCRSESAKNKTVVPKAPADESSSGSTGLKIDSKVKVQTDFLRQQLDKKQKESSIEERKLKDKNALDKIDLSEKKTKSQKDHRAEYIEAKQKKSFLNYKGKQQPYTNPAAAQRIQREKSFLTDHQQELATRNLQESIEHEFKQTSMDFSSGVSIDPQIAGLRFQVGDTFLRFETWLGKSAFMSTVKNVYGRRTDQAIREPGDNRQPDNTNEIDKNKPSKPSSTRGR